MSSYNNENDALSIPTTTTTTITTMLSIEETKLYEERLKQLLSTICNVIDGLRSYNNTNVDYDYDIKKLYNKSTVQCKQQDVDDDRQQLDNGKKGDSCCSLLTHLQSLDTIQQVQSIIKESIPTLQQQEGEEDCSRSSSDDDERRIILHQIILPLLNSLLQIYTILDKLPQSTSPLTSQSLSSADTRDTCKKNAKHKQNKHKPPIGMLSINDYTNIACLIEYSISITLIPLLEYGSIVYFPPLTIQQSTTTKAATMKHLPTKTTIISQKQCRELSKSLAGRISKYTLSWGTTYTFDYYNKLCDSLLLSSSNGSCAEDNETQQHQIIYNIYTKYNELASLSTTLTNLLTLDRFKPMLLNKYITNIYAMVFCCERLNWYLYKLDCSHVVDSSSSLSTSLSGLFKQERYIERNNSIKFHTLYKILGVSPLIFPSSLISRTTPQSNEDEVTTVDNHEMALAYRTLLGGGASMMITSSTNGTTQQQQQPAIPSWLKLRLGQCLTRLSMVDIVSVVDVFVAHANSSGDSRDEKDTDDVLTSAAMRLASALCAKPTTSSSNATAITSNSKQRRSNNDIYHERLCIQFINFLMKDGQNLICQLNKKKYDNDILQTSRSSMAMHLTLWAVLSQLSIDSIHSYFVGKLMSGLVLVPLTNDNDDAAVNTNQRLTSKQSVASIASWLLTIPSSIDPSTEKKVQSIILGPISSSKSDESKYSNKNEKFTMSNQLIRLAASLSSQDIVPSSNSNLIIEVDSTSDDDDDSNNTQAFARLVEMTIAQMIHILIIHRIKEDSHVKEDMNWLAIELLKSISTNNFDKDGYCFVVESKEEKSIVYRKRETTQQNDDVMPNLLISGIETRAKCLIRVIMSLSELSTGSSSESKLESDNNNPVNVLLSNLFQLALLIHYSSMSGSSDCEKKLLVKGNNSSLDSKFIHDNQDDMTMAATVVLATLCETCSPSILLLGSSKSDSSILDILGLIIKSASAHIERAAATNDESKEGNDSSSEELFSTTSIVLSLLIAMLELGADKRSESDESFFKSIIPSLHVLCSFGDSGSSLPEVAEMASHAMALIAARGSGVSAEVSEPSSNTTTDKMPRVDRILEKLSQAEKELQSTQPPLRAKGVVSLRHIARSLVKDDGVGGEDDASLLNLVNEKGNTKITEVQTTSDEPLTTISSKEELGLISRSLARVCLNALADTESYVYLAAIQTLVAISDVCPSEIMPLMGEAIAKGNNITISIADTVGYLSSITSVELSLSPEQRIKATESLIFMIRRRGEGIFMYGRSLLNVMLYGSSKDHANKDYQTAQLIQSQTHNYFIQNNNDKENNSDERRFRLNTGGPIYSIEENHLLRAGSISVTCELVTVLNPITVASYCHDLIKLVISALQLEESRPVRRAVACLARELYTCTLKEVTAELGNSKDSPATTMAIAIVKSNEVQMYNALISCVSLSNQGGASSRLIDPATQSRCSEAIDIREEIENIGILQVATLVAQSQENDSRNPTVSAVRKALA